MGQLRRDCQYCGWEAPCDRRTKINWTKTAHNTRICTSICGHLGCVSIHTHTHTHTVVWIRVEHWAYWRPQLVVAEKLVTPRQPTTTTTTRCSRKRGQSHHFWNISGNVLWSHHRGLVVNMYTNLRCLQYYSRHLGFGKTAITSPRMDVFR